MNESAILPVFFDGATALCAVMAFVNAGRTKSRGTAALALAGAFLALGVLAQAYRRNWGMPIMVGAGVALVAGLVADFVLRAPKGVRR